METSVIIRTKNEEKWIGSVLEMLQKQTYQDFEIIIVDSGSMDRTLEIANEYPVKIVHLLQKEFSYPHSLNVGCRESSAEKYFVFLSAHSVPISEEFLKIGVGGFVNDKVAGVYGPIRTLPDASIWEKMFFNVIFPFLRKSEPETMLIDKTGMGVLGNTNAIIRRDLWEKHNFDEAYGLGGEDQEWCGYWLKLGYVVAKNKKFVVMHSHGLGLLAFIKQWKNWVNLAKPHPFEKVKYRKWNW